MKHDTMMSRSFLQRGVTLIELMIALAIGLLIVLVITSAYMSGIGAQRAQTDLTRLEESARFGFDLVSRSVRRAGFRDTLSTYSDLYAGPIAQEICGADPAVGPSIRATNDLSTVDLGGGVVANIHNKSDSLTVRYYGQDNPDNTGPDGVVLDCLGNAVRRGTLVQDTIYVAADPANNNEPSLFCSTDNPAVVNPADRNLALIPGVESLQLLYAEDTDGDTVTNRYAPANKVAVWDDVRGVLVSLIVRTTQATGSDRLAKTFKHFGDDYDAAANADAEGGTYTGTADGRVRLQFANFMSLRNFPVCK
ncbi:MAG: PilW family protein [Candidatus Methylophosphatis roskildensis]